MFQKKKPKTTEELRQCVKQHFDGLAHEYDRYKLRSAYYYSQLKNILDDLVSDAGERSILEIGCGTGSLLVSLKPEKGLGIDISDGMIAIAQKRWKGTGIQFRVAEAETLETNDVWNVVVMSDVIEHLYDPEKAVSTLSQIMKPGSTLIITWANSMWESFLHALEFMRLKMPEGEHNWAPRKVIVNMLSRYGFEIVTEGTRCLVPASIPLSNALNRSFHTVPVLKYMGLIRFIKATRV